VKFGPHRLPRDSFLFLTRTLTHIREVSAVSNAYHVHFYSVDHDEELCYCHDNTAFRVEDLDYCFQCLVVPDRTHAEVSMRMIVYCTHCHSTDQKNSLWNHCDAAHAEEEDLDYFSPLTFYDAALFLRYLCGCCEKSIDPDVVMVAVDADDDVVATDDDDDDDVVDMNLNDHMMMKSEVEGPSLPSHYFDEVMSTPLQRKYFDGIL
jgi:hypothetical protein